MPRTPCSAQKMMGSARANDGVVTLTMSGLLFFDHLAVIEIGVGEAETLTESFQALLAAIGNSDDRRLWHRIIAGVVAVRRHESPDVLLILDEAAHATGSDDGDSILLAHRSTPGH